MPRGWALKTYSNQISRRQVTQPKPYERNPRTHSDDQVAKVAASIASYGWTVPLLVTEDGAENLSAGIPRSADEIEAWMARLAG